MRHFSRADILKKLDKSKVSRRQYIKKELTENPEFFKAYPHLQSVFELKEDGEFYDQMRYHHDKLLSFKDP